MAQSFFAESAASFTDAREKAKNEAEASITEAGEKGKKAGVQYCTCSRLRRLKLVEGTKRVDP